MSTSVPDAISPQTRETKLALNRIVAFGGPYVAIASGALADWLIVHVHLLSLFHTTSTQVAGAITQLGVFGLTAILTWAGHHKWLTGWQKYETTIATTIAGGAFNGPEPALGTHPSELGDYDPSTAGGDSTPVLPPDEDVADAAVGGDPTPSGQDAVGDVPQPGGRISTRPPADA